MQISEIDTTSSHLLTFKAGISAQIIFEIYHSKSVSTSDFYKFVIVPEILCQCQSKFCSEGNFFSTLTLRKTFTPSEILSLGLAWTVSLNRVKH